MDRVVSPKASTRARCARFPKRERPHTSLLRDRNWAIGNATIPPTPVIRIFSPPSMGTVLHEKLLPSQWRLSKNWLRRENCPHGIAKRGPYGCPLPDQSLP